MQPSHERRMSESTSRSFPLPHRDDAARYHEFEHVTACPMCGSPDRHAVDHRADVVACTACGHRFVDPRPTQAEIARGYSMPAAYDAWIADSAEREALWRRRFDRVFGAVPPGRLLDVGAGVGTFLAIARDHGWTVAGTEVSFTAIDHAARGYGIALHHGMLEDAGLTGPYDAISLWHVLEHVPDPRATIRACRELLVEGGLLVLAMPNDGIAAWSPTALTNVARSLAGRTRAARYEPLRPGRESHIQHFAPATIRRLLSDEGFRRRIDAVDDAAPRRSRLGTTAYHVRRLLTAVTPWNFGREMLIVASRTARPRSWRS